MKDTQRAGLHKDRIHFLHLTENEYLVCTLVTLFYLRNVWQNNYAGQRDSGVVSVSSFLSDILICVPETNEVGPLISLTDVSLTASIACGDNGKNSQFLNNDKITGEVPFISAKGINSHLYASKIYTIYTQWTIKIITIGSSTFIENLLL